MELKAINHNPRKGHEKPKARCRIERSHKSIFALRSVETILSLTSRIGQSLMLWAKFWV